MLRAFGVFLRQHAVGFGSLNEDDFDSALAQLCSLRFYLLEYPVEIAYDWSTRQQILFNFFVATSSPSNLCTVRGLPF